VLGKLGDYVANSGQIRMLLILVAVLAAAVTALIVGDGEINGVKVSAGDGQLRDQSFEHADFLNGWNQDRLRFLINDCIRGVPLSGTRPDRCRLIDPASL
jgi:hypothetical protein